MPKTIKRMFRPGAALNLSLGLVALLTISAGFVWSGLPMSRSSMAVSNGELATALTRVGLDAAPLAAAGATALQVQNVVGAVREYLDTNAQTLRDRDQAWADARKELDRLTGLVQSGIATLQEISALGTAESTLATAASQRQATLTAIHDEGAAELTTPQRATISAIKASRAAGWDLPTQYLTVSREQADWVRLRNALANQRIAAKHGEQPSNAAQQVLNTANAQNTVAAANTNLTNSLTTTASTWHDAVFP